MTAPSNDPFLDDYREVVDAYAATAAKQQDQLKWGVETRAGLALPSGSIGRQKAPKDRATPLQALRAVEKQAYDVLGRTLSLGDVLVGNNDLNVAKDSPSEVVQMGLANEIADAAENLRRALSRIDVELQRIHAGLL